MPDENNTLNSSTQLNLELDAKIKLQTLQIIRENKLVTLEIPEIFDTTRYQNMIGVTYSASGTFINRYLSELTTLQLVVGIPEEKVPFKTNQAITKHNLVEKVKQDITNEGVSFYQSLNSRNQDNINRNQFQLFTPLGYSIHSKFYLLFNKDRTDTRLLTGSANLSKQAFSNNSPQLESIMIFDNDPLFDLYLNYYEQNISPILTNYIPKNLTETVIKKIKKLPANQEIEHAFLLSPDELSQVSAESYTETAQSIAKKIELGILPVDTTVTMRNTAKELQQVQQDSEKSVKLEESATKLVKEMVSPQSLHPKILTHQKLKLKFKQEFQVKKIMNIQDNVIELNQLYSQPAARNLSTHTTGFSVKAQQNDRLIDFGRSASTDEIRHGLKTIQHLLDNYAKFAIDYTTDYGSRVYEAILYAFTAPFLNEIRTNSTTSSQEGNDIPQFLFIGGTGGSGKSSLLKFISKMMGIYENQSYLDYNSIIPHEIRNAKSLTIQQIRNWIDSDNVAPLLIDEVPGEFFEKQNYGNDLVVLTTNFTIEKPHPFPAFIGTTNSEVYTFREQARRRSYYLKNDRVFDDDKRQESIQEYNDLMNEVTDSLFQDFIVRMSDLIESGEAEFNHYAEQGKIDFLYNTRQIFKNYYNIIGEPIPAFLPDSRYDDSQESNQERWRKLFLSAQADFRYNNENKSIFFRITSVDENDSTRFGAKQSFIYRNALSPKVVKGGMSGIDIELKVPEFFDWIGIDNPFDHKTLFTRLFGHKN